LCYGGACTWPCRQQDVVNRQLSTHYTFRQLKEKLQVADFASERMTCFNTLLFPAIATIRLIARYGRRLHWEEGNPAYARKVIKCGIAQPVCRTGFLEIACDCPSSVWYPNSDSCGRTAGCGSQPVILNKDIAPREDGRYFPRPALEALA